MNKFKIKVTLKNGITDVTEYPFEYKNRANIDIKFVRYMKSYFYCV